MIITNSRYALVGYLITSYPTRPHGIIVIYSLVCLHACFLAYLFICLFVCLFIFSFICKLFLYLYVEHNFFTLSIVCLFLVEVSFYLIKYHLESSKQRTRLRSKISTEKAKLTSRIQQYNEQTQGDQVADLQSTCTVTEVMKGNFPWGGNAGEL